MKKSGLIFFIFVMLLSYYSSTYAVKYEYGDKGEDIKRVQQYLYNMGYDISIDGVFGYGTQDIVKDFQFNNGLIVDGIIGDKTLEKIEDIIRDITYIVKEGDTLSEIAVEYNSTVKSIKGINNLKSDFIKVGQELKIPKTGIGGGEDKDVYSSIYHKVNPGDVLSVLAKKYGVDVTTIKLANNLKKDTIYIGQTLIIPYLKGNSNQPFKLAKGAFIWPVIGRISSGYGYRVHPIRGERHFHGGLDIAVPLGTEIRAAASGTVIKSGYLAGFGNTIVIDHGNGIETLYGHNSSLLVRVGMRVNLGQVIAKAGSTGSSTGSHLDFRIYKNSETVNPLNYLP